MEKLDLEAELKFQFLIGRVKRLPLHPVGQKRMLFQFLIGRVKRINQIDKFDSWAQFQFLIGRVKRLGTVKVPNKSRMFQFLIGRVKSRRVARKAAAKAACFNSLQVESKELTACFEAKCPKSVSIPYRQSQKTVLSNRTSSPQASFNSLQVESKVEQFAHSL